MKKIISVILIIVIFSSLTIVVNANKNQFSDVDKNHWAYNNIMHMVSKGVVSGDPDGRFRPEDNVTRAEFCVMLSKCANLNIDMQMSKVHWALPYTNAMKSKTWTYKDWYLKEFDPDAVINRGEAAMGLCEIYLGYPLSLNHKMDEVHSYLNSKFKDASYIGGFSEVVYIMSTENLMNGYEDGCFHHDYNITRAEMCAILDRAFGAKYEYYSNTNLPDYGSVTGSELHMIMGGESTSYTYRYDSNSLQKYFDVLNECGYYLSDSEAEYDGYNYLYRNTSSAPYLVMIGYSNSDNEITIFYSGYDADSFKQYAVEYYDGYDIQSFTAVTGIPVYSAIFKNGKAVSYYYDLTTYGFEESVEKYMRYVNSCGWDIEDSGEKGNLYYVFMVKGGKLLMLSLTKLDNKILFNVNMG